MRALTAQASANTTVEGFCGRRWEPLYQHITGLYQREVAATRTTVEHRELCSVLCGSLAGRGFGGRRRVCVLSCVQPFATPRTRACQAALSMGCSRQEYWSGLPFPPPGNLPNPGIKPASLVSPALASRFFTAESPGKPLGEESDQIRSVTQLCPTLCNPMNRSTPGLRVHHQLPEFTQTPSSQ